MNKNEVQVMEQQPGLITPAGSLDQTVEQFRIYQQMRSKLGTRDDFQRIGDKHHPKKSFVRKVQRFFNLSCEIVQDEPLRDQEGNIIAWLAKARAIHLGTGAFQEADGSCGFDEKLDKYGRPDKKRQTIHNIRAHAVTRAKNRAILDLVGFGEVSAEEINPSEHDYQPQQQRQQASQPAQRPQGNGLLSQRQHNAIFAIGKGKKLDEDQIKGLVKHFTGKDSVTELTGKEASDLIGVLQATETPDLLELIGEAAQAS